MSDLKFKVGDNVKIVSNTYIEGGSAYDFTKEEAMVGQHHVIEGILGKDEYPYRFKNGGMFHEGDLEWPKRTIEDVEVGDVVSSTYGDKRVLARTGELIFLSLISDHQLYGNALTMGKLKEHYELFQNPPEETINEYTLEEVAKLAGVDVKSVRIKE